VNRPAYLKYKPSGVDWLGEVPEHWEVKRSDGVIHSESSQIAPEQFSDRDVFHYSIPNVQEYGTGAIEEGESIASAKQVISSRVVLVSKLNPRKATVCIAEPTELLTLCSGELVQLHAKHCHVTYLYYLCLNELFRQRLDATVQSVTRSHQRAYPHDIYRFWHAWPPLPEQRAIANFLDRETSRLDTLVGKKRELIARLKERRAALITRAVTRGLDPAAKLKDSGVAWLGMVPEGWEVPPFYTRYKVELGKMLDEARITGDHLVSYLRNVDVQWDTINLEDLPEMDILPNEYERYTLRKGDLVVCEGGEVGRAAIFEGSDRRVGFQKALHRLRPARSEEVPRYIFYVLCSAAQLGVFVAEGNPNTIPHLTGEKLRRYRFPCPPLAEQRAIADYLDRETGTLDRLTASVEAAIERLQEYRAALITAAVTGKIDVRKANAKEAA